jgi:hypothetical protein
MRFLPDGPSIPDELLVARDEGRVVFFCGAGVSRVAGLADFFGLAKSVVDALGSTDDSPSRRILQEAKQIQDRTGIGGLISVDRVFSLLGNEFDVRDIEAEVAKALRPPPQPNLSAHKTMLDLAKSDGITRLVTTNFDLLFEDCDSSLRKICPPRLPDPKDTADFDGVLHLHGCVDADYQSAFGDGFILSSSDFGKAYLAEGTATSFIKSILGQYVVVFVGYSADDPPVQYLLEALSRKSDSYGSIYAFQSGLQDEVEARWRHKGVIPVAYSEENDHKALWDTLESWACRARNPKAWHRDVIVNACKGPEALMPHERGQIAHIVSTLDGMRQFVSSEEPPPADWLCVFDPILRYSKPREIWKNHDRVGFFDPFDAYGLDCDPVPQKIIEDNPSEAFSSHVKREVPPDVWSCFAATKRDKQNLGTGNIASFVGTYSTSVPNLPERLYLLCNWFRRIAHQPAAAWWAAQQNGLHPSIQEQIRSEIWLHGDQFPTAVRKAWSYIFESLDYQSSGRFRDFEQLKKTVERDGWSSKAIREYSLFIRPGLRVKTPFSNGPKPPKDEKDLRLRDIIEVEVVYSQRAGEINIPDDFLSSAVREYRKNLEYAVSLEKEVSSGFIFSTIKPIVRDPNVQTMGFNGVDTLDFLFRSYLKLVKRLIEKDKNIALQEYRSWNVDDDTIFVRLRIWFSGEPNLLSESEAGRLICELSDAAFWDRHHQRDLLLVLQKRWNEYLETDRKEIEHRLLNGREPWTYEDEQHHKKWSAWLSLDRIHWLSNQGCQFDFDLTSETTKLSKLAQEWKSEYAETVVDSTESRGGMVQTITEHDELLSEPLGTLIEKAKEIDEREKDFLKERDSFTGLSVERPVRAFSALVRKARKEQYLAWAWKKFLYAHSYSEPSKQGKSLTPRFVALIMEWISRLPIETLSEILHPVSRWLFDSSETIYQYCPDKLESVWACVINALKTYPECGKSTITSGQDRAWTSEAINSATGKLVDLLRKDPIINKLEKGSGFPEPWKNRAEGLLTLDGDSRRYALVEFGGILSWTHWIDPEWTENNLLSVLEREGDDLSAFWAGYFRHQQQHGLDLYLILKPHLLKIAERNSHIRRSHTQILSGILLAGWGSMDEESGSRLVSDQEMRVVLLNSDEEFRTQTLWHLERWCSNNESEWETKCPVFLEEVWPVQKTAKSPKISSHLCQVALSNKSEFPRVADTVEGLVGRTNQNSLHLYGMRNSEDSVIEKFPKRALDFFYIILPENVSEWPYGFGEVLERIGEADKALCHNDHFIDLKRRWDAR